MKFSTFPTILALASLLTSVISAPTAAVEELQVKKRDDSVAAAGIIGTLDAAIAAPVADIHSILSGISASSSSAKKATAVKAIKADVASIVSSIKTATASVKALPPTSKLARRQLGSLQDVLTTLLTDINGIAEGLVSALGLGTTLSILNPLISSLSGLLLSLETVVDNLLALVETIVNSLLTGLSIGLAGLTL